MIVILACRCHASEPLARKALRENHCEGWQTFPIIKGRQECINALNQLPQNQTINAIKEYLKRVSSWTIIIGTDGEEYRWADIGKGKIIDRLDGDKILEDFYGQ